MNDSNANSNNFEELCSGYVLNALSKEEQHRFEAMLKSADKSQWDLYDRMQASANQIAFTVGAETPSPSVKEAVMREIRDDDNVISITGKSKTNRFMSAAAAAFALLIISVALVFYAFNLNDTIGDQQARITELQAEVQQREELLSILSARTVDLVVMSGQAVNTDGYGKIIWDPETEQALLQVSNLPPEPEGKDYQLWLFRNNTPLPAGVFSVNTTDEASFFKIEELPDVSEQAAGAFAVSLEPEGGAAQPTGDIYLLGSAE